MQKYYSLSVGVLTTLLVFWSPSSWLMPESTSSETLIANFIVDSTSDAGDSNPGDGICDSGCCGCTLRAAMEEANATAAADVITFSGVNAVSPSFDLPIITNPLTINGGSTGGVVINGGAMTSSDFGLNIQSSDVNLYGLAIQNFADEGILIPSGGNYDNITIGDVNNGCVSIQNGQGLWVGANVDNLNIVGSFFGTDTGYHTGLGNTNNGIRLQSSGITNATIGGPTAAHGNVIGGNGSIGLEARCNVTIQNNIIGTDDMGTADLGNPINVNLFTLITTGTSLIDNNTIAFSGQSGISCEHDNVTISNNQIYSNTQRGIELDGSNCSINNNEIYSNNLVGVVIDGGTQNLISQNEIYCNVSQGIFHSSNGNNNMPSPSITSASTSSISGTAQANSTIEVFIQDETGCPGQDCQGRTFVGLAAADGAGNWTMSAASMVNPPANGDQVIATATDASNNSSEFSTCLTVSACPGGTTVTVTNTNDSGDGSLREAINCANADPLLDNIEFSIMGTPPFVINLATVLPDLTDDDVTINGTTNGNVLGDIVIDGGAINDDYIIEVFGDNFTLLGMHFDNNPEAVGSGALYLNGSNNGQIGSNATGNLFTNGYSAIVLALSSSNCVVENNIIGTDLTLTQDLGFSNAGISIIINSNDNIIRNNTIAYTLNNSAMLINQNSSRNLVSNNSFICNVKGIDLSLTNNVGNLGIDAPVISSVSTDEITGTAGANETIEVFISSYASCTNIVCQGRTFLGTATSDVNGSWVLNSANYQASVSSGDDITATTTDANNNTSEFAACLTISACPTGTTVTVTNTNDSGSGSLREAINCVNADPLLDIIEFNINGTPPFVIDLVSSLPTITDDNVALNVNTQPGWTLGDIAVSGQGTVTIGLTVDGNNFSTNGLFINSCTNTQLTVNGLNASIDNSVFGGVNASGVEVRLQGDGATFINSKVGTTPDGLADFDPTLGNMGLRIEANNVTVDNSVFSGNSSGTSSGIYVAFNDVALYDNITITNNKVGTDINGQFAIPNSSGITLLGVTNSIIANNIVSGNNGTGISLAGCVGGTIENNEVGVSGNVDIPNTGEGIAIRGLVNSGGSTDLTIGPDNIVANNERGVTIGVDCERDLITQNQIFCNTNQGIWLFNVGNINKPSPTITSATVNAISGTAAAGDIIEVFEQTQTCQDCQDGNPQARNYLGSATADGTGNWSLNGTFMANSFITATATDVNNNTSIFATCAEILALDEPFTLDFSATSPSCQEGTSGYIPDASIDITVNDPTTCGGAIYDIVLVPVMNSSPSGTTPNDVSPSGFFGVPAGIYSFAAAGAGDYDVVVTEVGGPCNPPVNPETIVASVPNGPAPTNINPTPVGPFCADADVVALNTTQSGFTGSWSGPGIACCNEFNPASVGPGNWDVTFTPDAGQCVNAAILTITVNALPDANATILSACDNGNGEATFDLTSIDPIIDPLGNPVSWFEDAATTIPISTPSNYISSGTNVYAVVSNGLCSSLPVQIPLTVEALPLANPTVLSACEEANGQATFNLNSANSIINGGTGFAVEWYEDQIATIPIGNPNSYQSASSTVYSVVNNGLCSSLPIPIDLIVIPTTVIVPDPIGPYCDTDPIVSLATVQSGIPGSWSGPGIDCCSEFNPSTAGVGVWTLTFTPNGGECANPVQVNVTVNMTQNLIFSNLQLEFCDTDLAYQLPNFSDNGTPGTWDIGDTFDPALFTGTTTTLTFTALDNFCAFPYEANFTVYAEPSIINIDAQNPDDCGVDNGSINITDAVGINLEYSINGGINWQTNPNFCCLGAGTYNVVIREIGVDICEDTEVVTLTAPMAPVIDDIILTNPSDCFETDGSIEVQATGISLEYSIDGIIWQSENIFSNLPQGDYTVQVREVNSPDCTASQDVSLTDPPVPVILDIILVDPSCDSNTDGSITIVVQNAGASTEYSIDGGQNFFSDNLFPALASGDYDVVVREAATMDCQTATTVNLSALDAPTIVDVISTNPSDCFETDGSIEVQATGISLEYSIDGIIWQSENIFSNLPQGDYTVQVREVNAPDCISTEAVTLVDPPVPVILDIILTNPTDCSGGSADGQIEILVQNAGASTEYSIDGGQNFFSDNIFLALASGDYDVVVREAATMDCQTATMVNLSGAAAPVINDVILVDPSDCFETDGSIEVQATGISLEYSIDGIIWQSENIFSNLPQGDYTVQVREVNAPSCVSTEAVSLIDPPVPVILDIILTNPTDCSGGSADGQIEILVQNAGASTEYSIDGGQNFFSDNIFPALASGDYDVVVREAATMDCQTATMVNLSGAAAPVINDIVLVDPSDCFEADGSIEVQATGISLEYSIDGIIWQSENIFSNLPQGDYTVQVREVNAPSCVSTEAVSLVDPPVPVILDIILTNPTDCSGGSADGQIEILVQNAGASTEYSIDGGQNFFSDNIFPALASGDYDVVVREAATMDCQTATMVNLSGAAAPVINDIVLVDPSDCFETDGSIEVQATGISLEYSIDGIIWQSENIFSNLPQGDYTVQVREVNAPDCISTEAVTLVDPPVPVILDIIITNDVSCFGSDNGQIEILVQNAGASTEYSIDGGQNFFSDNFFPALAGGDYDVVVREAATMDCTTTQTINVATIDSPQTSCSQQNPVSSAGANDGEAAIGIQGGTAPYTIDYSGPSSGSENAATEGTYIFDGLAEGTYTFTVTDDNGCFETCTVVIEVLGGIVCDRLQDSLALVDLYFATDGPSWLVSWDLLQPMETWFGLAFTPEGCVEEVALGANNLVGTLPASLGTLSQIQRLYLFENGLGGNLPPELGNASTLQQIFIYSNQFDGNLPVEWHILNNLQGLSLFDNNLSGVIPEEWGDLQSLIELYLNSNQLSGNIPASFSGMPALEILHLDDNRLDAPLPSLPPSIQEIRIQENRLVFRDLLPEAAALLAIPDVIYAPQAEVLSFEEIMVTEGTNVTINDTYPGPDPSNDYEWYKDNAFYSGQMGGGIPPLEFLPIQLSDAGTYQLQIRNATLPDLTLSSRFKIINVDAIVDCTDSDLTFAFGDLQGPSCGISNNGFAGVVPFLGVSPYTYLWSNGDTNPVATNLSEGQYGFTITDAEGCTVEGMVNLPAINPIELTCPDDIDVIIEADENGILLEIPLPDTGTCPADSVRHFVEGATVIPDSPGAVGIQFFNVGVTTVTYYVPGLDTCTFVVNVRQAEDPCDDFAVTPNQVQSPICDDGNDGFIELTVSGGDGNYEFLWSNGETTEDLNNLEVGLYGTTITDGSGCEISVSFWLQGESELELSCEGIPFSNYGQMSSSIQLFTSGGQEPYTIDFDGPVSGSLIDQVAGEIFIDDLPEGDYVITLTDASGCVKTCATSVFNPCTIFECPEDITLFIEADSLGIFLDIPGPDVGDCGLDLIQYYMEGATAQGDTPGAVGIQFFNVGITTVNYFVPGKDTCSFNIEILKVSDPCDDFAIIPNQVQSPLCAGEANGMIEITVVGGDGNYTYNWSNGAMSEDLTDLTVGLYTLTLVDGNGCEVSASFWLQEPDAVNLVCDHIPGSGIISFDIFGGTGPYNADITGPVNAMFSDINEGFYEFEDAPVGDYTITITDANGCVVFCDVSVVEEFDCNDLVVDVIVANSSCLLANGGATAMALGGSGDYSYEWSEGTMNAFLEGVFAGSYGLTVTDNVSGCILTTDIVIENVGEAEQFGIEETICSGESYLFNGEELTEEDTYTAILVNEFGCDSIVTLVLTVVEISTEILGDPDYCENEIEAHRFEVEWDGEVLWSTGSTENFVDILPTDGTLSVTITDDNGCTATDEINLSISPSPEVEIMGVLEVCEGELTTVTASGGVNYEWSIGAFGPVAMLPSGIHAVSVTNAEGCETVELVEIIENDLPVLPIYDPIVHICFGIIPELSINNPLPDIIVDWFNANNDFLGSGNTFQPQGAGNYFAQMRNTVTGCVSIELAMFQVFPDSEPPVFDNCPDDELLVVVWNTAQDPAPILNIPDFTATDNCSDVDIFVQVVDTAPIGEQNCGPFVITASAADASGNVTQCSYNIEILKVDDLTFIVDTSNIDYDANIFDVPVLARDFNNVSGFQFTMMLSDTSGGSFLGLTPLAPELEDGLAFNIENDTTMRILWSEVVGNPNQLSVTLPDSTPIFSIQLSLPGDPGDCDMLMFADDPVNKVAIRDNVGEVIPGTIDGEVCIPEIATITGRIYREDDQGVKNVEVSLITEEGTLMSITDTDGNYFFDEVPMGMNYTIIPFKNDNHPNGLSLVDITRIRDYILFGPQSLFLETPYRKISADATNNTNISLTDLTTLIVLRISGPDAVLPNNTSWRFVDADHEFQNPDIPWLGGFPEEKFIATLDRDTANNDFIAMKIGDVNLTAATQLFPATPHYLEIPDQELVENQTVLIPINAHNMNDLIGLELDLAFDPSVMKLEGIVPGDLPLTDFIFNEDRFREGVLSGLWLNMFGEDFGDEEMTLFYLEVTPKTTVQLSSEISLGYEYMESIGVTNDHRAIPLQLVFTDQAVISSTNDLETAAIQLMGAFPNPFDESTNIQFFLPTSEQVQIEVYDLSGKLHWTEVKDLSSGYQEWSIGDQEISSKGIYFYRLLANGKEVYGKLIKQ